MSDVVFPRRWNTLRLLQAGSIVILLGIIAWVCAYKIADFDFWWHVKAGEIMMKHLSIIRTDPFAFTRAGLPYQSTHEWLAQIILFGVFRLGGVTGIILLRTLIVAGIVLTLLSVDTRRLWINAPLAVLAVTLALHGFVDRPQLFSYLLFSCDLVLLLRYLEIAENDFGRRRRFLLWLLLFQFLWVNVHGAAALLGIFLFACMLVQRGIDIARGGWRPEHRREILVLALTGAGLILVLFASPSGIGNIEFLRNLLTDRTVLFIREWEPRRFGLYLRDLGLLWIAVIAVIGWTGRRWVFCGLVLLVMGILSRQAFRHEMFVVIAAFGIIFFELRWNMSWQRWTDRLLARPMAAVAVMTLLFLVGGFFAASKFRALNRNHNLAGYGSVTPARDAANFLEGEKITGHLFNSYELGGYLEFRGFPVFMDGRNVDFGYEFLKAAFDAAQNETIWKQLEERYDLTIAVIYYDLLADLSPMPYVAHLEKRSDWILTHLDDWTAVYLKNTLENRVVIEKHRYRFLTPEGLQTGSVLDHLTSEQGAVLEKELIRVIQGSPESLKPRLLLARLYALAGLSDDAATIMRDAMRQWPERYEPIELLASLYAAEEKWAEAGALYENMIAAIGDANVHIDYAAIADVFEKVGDAKKAENYRHVE